jgi:muramoyltetrapeptide carboxypeptidase
MKLRGIGIVAPSGYVVDVPALARAVHWFRANDIHVVVDDSVYERDTRFAGADAERIASLHRMFARDDIDIVMAARGGYGLARLLDHIDYDLIARSRKIFCGHSDCTALQMAMLAQHRTPSLAGPTACHDFGPDPAVGVSEFTRRHWRAALAGDPHRIDVVEPTNQPSCDVSGLLWGGNLCTLVHLIGTPYLPVIDGGILFIEDVYEHPYRVERMLLQLHYAGVLDAQRAILLGAFNGYRLLDSDNGYDLASAIELICTKTSTPILTGLPFGHIRDKVSLAVGGLAEVRCDGAGTGSGGGWSLTVTPPEVPWLRLRQPAPFTMRSASWQHDGDALRAVRRAVFIDEQAIPEELEWDDSDPVSMHALGSDHDGRPIATGRLLDDGHIGRKAVVREWRGHGVGAALFEYLIATAAERGHRVLFLNAQTQVADFYTRYGFVRAGDEFIEAGIPHIAMERR